MSEHVVEPKRRLSREERRTRILATALDHFAAHGYQGTSLVQIAADLKITHPVLYDYFPSKQALYMTVLEEQNTLLLHQIAQTITGSGTTEQRMRATAQAFLEFTRRSPASWQLLFNQAGHSDPHIQAAHQRIREEQIQATITALKPDARRTRFTATGHHDQMRVKVIISALDGLARWWAEHPGTPITEVLDVAMEMLWTGIAHFTQPS